jgi:hypothetical protein
LTNVIFGGYSMAPSGPSAMAAAAAALGLKAQEIDVGGAVDVLTQA